MKLNPDPLKIVDVPVCTGCRKRAPWCSCGKMDYQSSKDERTTMKREALGWDRYELSKGRGRSGWLVIEERDDGSFIEALVYADKDQPITVQHITYGPRGGIQVWEAGTAEGLDERIQLLRSLRAIALELEAKR